MVDAEDSRPVDDLPFIPPDGTSLLEETLKFGVTHWAPDRLGFHLGGEFLGDHSDSGVNSFSAWAIMFPILKNKLMEGSPVVCPS